MGVSGIHVFFTALFLLAPFIVIAFDKSEKTISRQRFIVFLLLLIFVIPIPFFLVSFLIMTMVKFNHIYWLVDLVYPFGHSDVFAISISIKENIIFYIFGLIGVVYQYLVYKTLLWRARDAGMSKLIVYVSALPPFFYLLTLPILLLKRSRPGFESLSSRETTVEQG